MDREHVELLVRQLRVRHPHWSLSDVVAYLSPNIAKSGVHRIWRKMEAEAGRREPTGSLPHVDLPKRVLMAFKRQAKARGRTIADEIRLMVAWWMKDGRRQEDERIAGAGKK